MMIKTTRIIYGILFVKNYEVDCCCWCSVTQSCSAFCNPMNCSMPGFHVLHYFPKFAQTHVHQVGDAIQLSCSQSSPSPTAFNLSQPQGFFPSELALHIRWPKDWAPASASVLPMNIKGWFPLALTGLISLPTKGLPEVFSKTPAQRNQFFGTQYFFFFFFFFYCPALISIHDYWKNYSFDYMDLCWQSDVSAF